MTKINTLVLSFFIIPSLCLAVVRPVAKTSLEETKAICKSWSKDSLKKGVYQLIVAFEGLASYSNEAAQKSYQYFDDFSNGKKVQIPKLGSMNFLNENLLLPHMKRISETSEILILSESSQRKDETIAELCITEWVKTYQNKIRLIILGHSFGGYAAINLSRKLSLDKIEIDEILTMDARAMPNEYKYFTKSDNVNEVWNYFHKGPLMPGYAIKGAKNTRVNTDHVGVTKVNIVQNKFLEILN